MGTRRLRGFVVLPVLGCLLLASALFLSPQQGQLSQGGVPKNTNPDLQYPLIIGGDDSGTVRTVAVDSSGHVIVAGAGSTDPCQSQVKSSAPISITTATTTSLVSGVGGKVITVCGFSVSMVATLVSDTFQLEYGTGGTCTSPTTLTGVISSGILTTGSAFHEAPYSLNPTSVGANLCAVTTVGTGPSIQGELSYVQQ